MRDACRHAVNWNKWLSQCLPHNPMLQSAGQLSVTGPVSGSAEISVMDGRPGSCWNPLINGQPDMPLTDQLHPRRYSPSALMWHDKEGETSQDRAPLTSSRTPIYNDWPGYFRSYFPRNIIYLSSCPVAITPKRRMPVPVRGTPWMKKKYSSGDLQLR